jgi:ABC-type polar amino acid transport system ATPase subunit
MGGGLNMLAIEDLQVKIGDREVLRHIDLEIKTGETHIPCSVRTVQARRRSS